MSYLLTILLALPIVGACVAATLPQGESQLGKGVGLAFAVLEFLVSLPLLTSFVVGNAGYQFETNVPWMREFGVSYHVGIDGFSLWIVLLTTLLTPLCILGARSEEHTSELQSQSNLVCRLLLEKKKPMRW